MKKFLILVTLLVVALALVIPQVVLAKENADKGPLTKKVFIHYKNPNAKPDGFNPGKPPKEDRGWLYLSCQWGEVEDGRRFVFKSENRSV